ncbi:ABC transporter substrate-binding protein [Paenibacillus radicis (ex Xue et al. 2023)]|uniref:Extracellular solute-binding protein n=1 Tax=Paenibacillus radicis (ex Xue et al. 2023) TaxID=2972489 RepID=A0ABT1YAL0_9BACL|nr:extracellular solute-binding protein [Paenibacillus radicis (ex Xue et al. 2023)]MCR8630235.1 extracellular solute-binding protein [Paenibacillus radicis (ex Xue et al. 2023)]
MKKWLYMIFIAIIMTSMTACSFGGSEEMANTEKMVSKGKKTVVTLALQEWPSTMQKSSEFFRTVEKKFEEKYPDIDLQIQISEDYEKYKKTTNAALLSGKGPDIFEISSLPIDDYVSKKLLLNMDESMGQDKTLNKSDLQMNILDVMKLNGGMYAMPIGFSLRAFVGDGDILKNANVDDKKWTWKEFEETSKKLGKSGTERRYALANDPPEVLLQEMIVDKYSEFVDHTAKKAKFDAPLFIEAMKQIKKMYDDKVMTSEPADIGKQMFCSTVLQSPADLVNGLHQLFSNPKLLQKPEQTGGARIITTSRFAIQAKSSVKEEAWKVIAFLLSEEGQSLQERQGFSMLKSVNETQLNDIQKQVNSGTYKLPDGRAPKVSDEEFTQFKQFIRTANNFTKVDGSVISIVGDESRSFFSEQKSPEEVAKLIQNKATTFLNE